MKPYIRILYFIVFNFLITVYIILTLRARNTYIYVLKMSKYNYESQDLQLSKNCFPGVRTTTVGKRIEFSFDWLYYELV